MNLLFNASDLRNNITASTLYNHLLPCDRSHVITPDEDEAPQRSWFKVWRVEAFILKITKTLVVFRHRLSSVVFYWCCWQKVINIATVTKGVLGRPVVWAGGRRKNREYWNRAEQNMSRVWSEFLREHSVLSVFVMSGMSWAASSFSLFVSRSWIRFSLSEISAETRPPGPALTVLKLTLSD